MSLQSWAIISIGWIKAGLACILYTELYLLIIRGRNRTWYMQIATVSFIWVLSLRNVFKAQIVYSVNKVEFNSQALIALLISPNASSEEESTKSGPKTGQIRHQLIKKGEIIFCVEIFVVQSVWSALLRVFWLTGMSVIQILRADLCRKNLFIW